MLHTSASTKRTDSINMHRNCRETSLYMSAPALRHHTRNSRIYHHQWGINQPWEKVPCRHIMGREKPTVASPTLTSQGIIPAWLWTTSQGRSAHSGYQSKGGLNGWIHWWHHHHYHLKPTMGGARQEHRFIDHPHHIHTLAFQRTPETIWPLSPHKISGEGQISEHKNCLGWDIQTYSLWVFLPW